MTYSTILTSKGTTTIPATIRRKLGLKPGMAVVFSERKKPGKYVVEIERDLTIGELRVLNQAALKRAGTWNKPYYSGAGFEAYVMDKYGKQRR